MVEATNMHQTFTIIITTLHSFALVSNSQVSCQISNKVKQCGRENKLQERYRNKLGLIIYYPELKIERNLHLRSVISSATTHDGKLVSACATDIKESPSFLNTDLIHTCKGQYPFHLSSWTNVQLSTLYDA